MIERFLIDLTTVDPDSLRMFWSNTLDIGAWDSPLVEDFFMTVRKVNEGLDREARIRVWGGNAPIDWANVHSIEDYAKIEPKNHYAERLVRSQFLATSRRVRRRTHSSCRRPHDV